ncbi:MAG: RNA-binding protein [Proteobacteria bacterium]|nr:RNA-binding protein [Pseudomonadota bacterium]
MAKRQHRLTRDGADSTSAAGPERLCAVTRESRDPQELIRFVLSPDGVVVPDLDRRLPGRGVWIGCDKRLVEKAIATQAFSKSLKVKAEAPRDLADRLDDLILKRVTGALSLANKAGLAVAGFEKVFSALEKGPVRAILHGADAAADGRSKIDRKYKAIQASLGRSAAIVNVLTIAQMSLAIGRGSVVHAALTPGGLSDRFLEEAERLARYRHSTIEAAPGAADEFSEFSS